MKRGPLTADELPHLEHRWAVIASFLDAASDATYTQAAGYTAGWRIYRGCMDGAIRSHVRFELWRARNKSGSPGLRIDTQVKSLAQSSTCGESSPPLVIANAKHYGMC
jgi:hypothetical protein